MTAPSNTHVIMTHGTTTGGSKRYVLLACHGYIGLQAEKPTISTSEKNGCFYVDVKLHARKMQSRLPEDFPFVAADKEFTSWPGLNWHGCVAAGERQAGHARAVIPGNPLSRHGWDEAKEFIVSQKMGGKMADAFKGMAQSGGATWEGDWEAIADYFQGILETAMDSIRPPEAKPLETLLSTAGLGFGVFADQNAISKALNSSTLDEAEDIENEDDESFSHYDTEEEEIADIEGSQP